MNKSNFAAGAKAAIPIALGYIPVGIACAILARQAGLTIWQTIAMSVTVYAGASQIMAAGMIAQGAGLMTMIITTFLLNLRHIIMSTVVMADLKNVPLRSRLIASFGVTDEVFAVFTTKEKQNRTIHFYAGLALVSWLSWIAGTAAGCAAMTLLPDSLSMALGVALYAMFIALLVPGLKGNLRLTLLVIATAGLNFFLTGWIGSGWALIFSTLAGAFCGIYFVDDPEEGQ